jgi:mono/diheme cytochrome c family protein
MIPAELHARPRRWVMNRRLIGSSLALLLVTLAACSTVAAQEDKSLLVQGKQLFTDQGCYGCHMIGKFGTPIAQDLSHLGAKYTVADVAKWLRDPAVQKPTAHMPKIPLTEAEVRALAVYLGSLR